MPAQPCLQSSRACRIGSGKATYVSGRGARGGRVACTGCCRGRTGTCPASTTPPGWPGELRRTTWWPWVGRRWWFGTSALVLLEVGSDVEGSMWREARARENPSGSGWSRDIPSDVQPSSSLFPCSSSRSRRKSMDLANSQCRGWSRAVRFPPLALLFVVSSMHLPPPRRGGGGKATLGRLDVGWKPSIHALIMSTCPKEERMRLWHVYLRRSIYAAGWTRADPGKMPSGPPCGQRCKASERGHHKRPGWTRHELDSTAWWNKTLPPES